jgi:type II secretory pathway component PulK
MTERKNGRGFALITALAVLMLLSMLGAAYLQYMTIEADEAKLDLRTLRARTAAEAGVRAAMAQLEAEFAGPGGLLEGSRTLSYACPVYTWNPDGGLVADERYESAVTVTVTDESARINLNHAPVRLLGAALGVDGATARAIRASLPHEGGAASAGPGARQWLASAGDLLARGLVTEEQFNALDRSLFTTASVADPGQPVGYLNLNGASYQVLAALMDVPVETAEAAAQSRPFVTIEDAAAAAGKDLLTFNLPPDPAAPGDPPADITFETNSFRIVSMAEVRRAGHTGRGTVEAVAAFDSTGRLVVTRWTAGITEDTVTESPGDEA